MKRSGLFCIAVFTALLIAVGISGHCAMIKDGTITDSAGELLVLGYDQFGYNYQAHLFNGRYCDYDRVLGGPYADVKLIMKWNDAWLSNQDSDSDGDNLLDRPADYIGSGAWVTNHMSGVNPDGTKWTYFTKIIAVPDDANNVGGIWYAADGTEIGPAIWGSFATIQQVESGSGATYISPTRPGLGNW